MLASQSSGSVPHPSASLKDGAPDVALKSGAPDGHGATHNDTPEITPQTAEEIIQELIDGRS